MPVPSKRERPSSSDSRKLLCRSLKFHMRARKRIPIVLTVFVCNLIVIYSIWISKSELLSSCGVLKLKQDDNREQLILVWTKIFDAEQASISFDSCRPPGNRCRLTTTRSLINESDVVIFHIWDINFSDMPTFRSPEQRWGFYNMESPKLTAQEEKFRNLPPHFRFNWTLTYR